MESLFGLGIIEKIKPVLDEISNLPEDEQITMINQIKIMLHNISPFKEEPVDCVLWVPGDQVQSNDYNPNQVAPPEMRLLELSISEDGYTQPIVTFKIDGHREVVDGFHRNRVGKECKTICKRIHGYLPVTTINDERSDRGDRIASTIRHNRARGKHQVQGMSDVVLELKRRNWKDEKICRQLGMDPDEVLRLTQIQGLAEMFADQEFSEAWEIDL
jgi:ParB-like chromosome segregation protein Spo0J